VRAEKWDAELYDAKHAFVWEKARGFWSCWPQKAGERILDLGCGNRITHGGNCRKRSEVVGVDLSPEMIAEAGRSSHIAI